VGNVPRAVAGRRTVIAALLVGYSLLAGATDSFTVLALIVTAIAAAAVIALAVRAATRRPPEPEERPAGAVAPWVTLGIVVLAWQLAAYLQSPRSDHPTVSSMLDAADTHAPLRAAVFLGWLLVGVALARR
jgi:hypothetical protein